jgi:hypothetical protein
MYIAKDISFFFYIFFGGYKQNPLKKNIWWRLKRMWKGQIFIFKEVFLRAIAVKTEYVEDSI